MNCPPIPPLSPRLAAVAAKIPQGSRLADIGSDHGLLPLWLLAQKTLEFCVASEVQADRASRIGRPATEDTRRFAIRIGDGLTVMRSTDRIDVVSICGLGGRSMARLLLAEEQLPTTVKQLVLQPQSHHSLVRRAVERLHFGIVAEQLVEDRGRIYIVICANREAETLDPFHELATSLGLHFDDLFHVTPRVLSSRCPRVIEFWKTQEQRLAHIATRRSDPAIHDDLARSRRILKALGYNADGLATVFPCPPESYQR